MSSNLIDRLLRREHLSRSEAAALLEAMLAPSATDAQIAAALTALAMKGETWEELVGFAEVMRARADMIIAPDARTVDTAGTGGSGRSIFNVSTAAALVVAACGVPVAKHGNRAATGRSGSADVLNDLRVRIELPIPRIQECLLKLGICFMFAPAHHRATRRVSAVRRRLSRRTIFNWLGPLTNPAGVRRQVIGVSDWETGRKMAEAARHLGCEHVWIVHGKDGLDELTLSHETLVLEATSDSVREFTVSPEMAGLRRSELRTAEIGTPESSARMVRQIIAERTPGVPRDLVLLNSAAALLVSGDVPNLADGVERAAAAIESGRAGELLERFIRFTNA